MSIAVQLHVVVYSRNVVCALSVIMRMFKFLPLSSYLVHVIVFILVYR